MKLFLYLLVLLPLFGHSQISNTASSYIKVFPHKVDYSLSSSKDTLLIDSIHVSNFKGTLTKDSLLQKFPFNKTFVNESDTNNCQLDYVVLISKQDNFFRLQSTSKKQVLKEQLSFLSSGDIIIIEQLLQYTNYNKEYKPCGSQKKIDGFYWVIK